jgi:uncharacterized protein
LTGRHGGADEPAFHAALGERIAALDLIRGVAVLGILLMNIVSFAMPPAAYMNPHAFGARGTLDDAVWAVMFVGVDGKMRGLFSFLFGASMLLVAERAEAKGESAATIHFARMGWLFAFGVAHLLLIWPGDILQHYALVGMVAFALRRQTPAQLVSLGIVLVVTQTLLLAALPIGIHAAAAEIARGHPSPEAVAAWRSYAMSFGVPARADLLADLAANRGSYAELFRYRLSDSLWSPLQALWSVGMETLAYMLFGMAALRTGLLTGEWPRRTYRLLAACCLGFGSACYAAMAWYSAARGFAMEAVTLTGLTLSTPVRPIMIVGYACLVIVAARRGGRLTERLSAAGRMAFSNYLLTSLICSALFSGWGLGWYGYLSRAQLYLVVAALWVLMLAWSTPWLARFRYGPLEWLWRSLARGALQPMR